MAGFPTCGEHRGIPLYAEQSERNLERSRKHIDRVYELDSAADLVAVCVSGDSWSPESRLFAFAKLKAIWQEAVDSRRVRPDLTIEDVQSHVAHIGTEWMPLQESSRPPDCPDDDEDEA